MKTHWLGWRGKIGVAILVVVAAVAAVTWWKSTAQKREIARLRKAIENLNATYPIARLVIEKETEAPDGTKHKHVRVTFVDDDGRECGKPIEATLTGSKIYFEALMITFQTPLVERGEARAMAFPTRLFTEKIAPEKGVELNVLDDDGVPMIYDSVGETDAAIPAPKYRRILKRFWYYANNIEKAAPLGIQVVQGKAVFTKCELRRYYSVYVKANGTLDVVAEKFWLNGE